MLFGSLKQIKTNQLKVVACSMRNRDMRSGAATNFHDKPRFFLSKLCSCIILIKIQ